MNEAQRTVHAVRKLIQKYAFIISCEGQIEEPNDFEGSAQYRHELQERFVLAHKLADEENIFSGPVNCPLCLVYRNLEKEMSTRQTMEPERYCEGCFESTVDGKPGCSTYGYTNFNGARLRKSYWEMMLPMIERIADTSPSSFTKEEFTYLLFKRIKEVVNRILNIEKE